MIDAAFASVGKGELLRFLALFILLVAGWLLSVSLAFRLHFANDTIRMLRANADTLTADEREAVEVTVEILEAGEVPKILKPHLLTTLRGLLERTAQNKTAGYVSCDEKGGR